MLLFPERKMVSMSVVEEVIEDNTSPPIIQVESKNSDIDIGFLLNRVVEKIDAIAECLQTLTESVHNIAQILETKLHTDVN